MTKVRQPEVVMVQRGTDPRWFRRVMEDAGFAFSMEPKPGLVPVYRDHRVLPRVCKRTKMRRAFCCCIPCRALRRRKHRASCGCWLCFADRTGGFIDTLGRNTAAGRWLWFLTLTFRTPDFPWARGYPAEQPRPSVDFVRHFFAFMIAWIEREIHARVEYFVAHQFGEIGGRLHLHCGLSWPGLFEYRWKDLEAMLWERAGFNRILPWEMDAGYYIGRYIGRDAGRSHWNFRVGFESMRAPVSVGRRVVAESATPDDSSRAYRQTLGKWHR
jgi:hypothetical protein